MNCADCRELLVGYIERLLDEQQGETVRRHLTACADCREELKQIMVIQKNLAAEGRRSNANDLEIAVMDAIMRKQAFELRKTKEEKQHLNFWRLVMKNRISQLATAAAIIIVVLAAVYFITGKTPSVTCCAWAQIADKVQQIKTCVCNMHIRQSGGIMGQQSQEVESILYVSSDYGYRTDTQLNGELMQQMYMMTDSNAMIMVMPSEKKYMRMILTDDFLSKMKLQMQDPISAVTYFMTGDLKELGKDTINGVEVQGVEVNNPAGLQGVYSNFIGRMWVDVATEYPVRIEIEAEIGTDSETINQTLVMDEFDWGVELSEDIFRPDIPADFTMLAEMKLPGQDETGALEGLRFFAELTNGKYPSSMNVMTLTKEGAEIFGKKFGAAGGGKPSDEQMQEMTAQAMKMHAPVIFYQKLVQEGKDPAYYGKDVNFGDANTVLMRWKISDDTYRVVFGDLAAENVTAEQLKEMEQPPQQ